MGRVKKLDHKLLPPGGCNGCATDRVGLLQCTFTSGSWSGVPSGSSSKVLQLKSIFIVIILTFRIIIELALDKTMYISIGVWGGGQGGGAAAPPAFGQLSFLGSGGPFFGQQQWWEGGVFQFSGGRMTSRGQCPRGGVLVNVQEWVFFNFPEGEWRHADNVQGGGGACEIPPSGNPVSAPVICVIFWAINPSAP